jgi:hypothetical protein
MIDAVPQPEPDGGPETHGPAASVPAVILRRLDQVGGALERLLARAEASETERRAENALILARIDAFLVGRLVAKTSQ